MISKMVDINSSNSMPIYYQLWCRECGWMKKCWLRREAEIAGEAHEHECYIQPSIIMDKSRHPELGFMEKDNV